MRAKYLFIALVMITLLGIGYSNIVIAKIIDEKTGILSTGLEDLTQKS